MLRLLAAAAVLALVLPAGAAAPSRWTSTPLEGAQSLVVAGRDASALIVLRNGMDPLRSFDGGGSWTAFTVAGRRPVQVKGSPTDARAWYAEVQDAGVYRTRDGGDTWTPIAAQFLSFGVGANPDLLVEPRAVAPAPGSEFLGATPLVGLRVSSDGGETWQNRDFPEQRFAVRIFPSPVDARVIFILWGASFSIVQRSDDQGATWRTVTPPVPATSSFMDIVLDRRDPGIAYLTEFLAPEAWVTRDSGTTWIRAALPANHVIQADALSPGRAFAFGSEGLFETRDGALSWVKADEVGSGSLALVNGKRKGFQAGDSKLAQLDLDDGALALGSDLWWNPAESGAGFTITQHASNRPFIVWYTYDATGAPVWRVIPGGAWNDRTFTGEMFETTGPAYFTGPFDPARVASRSLGSATLRFEDEDNATFTYSMGAGGKPITRQLFAPAAPSATENYADLWWNPAESGWGVGISHQYNRIFATWYVYGNDGKPLWVVMPDAVVGFEFVGAAVRSVAAGDIYTARGPAEGAPFDPAQVVPTKVGTASLHFRGGNDATLEYTAFGRTESRIVTRQAF